MTVSTSRAIPKNVISPIFSKIISPDSKSGTNGMQPRFVPIPAEQQVKIVSKLIDHLKSDK